MHMQKILIVDDDSAIAELMSDALDPYSEGESDYR